MESRWINVIVILFAVGIPSSFWWFCDAEEPQIITVPSGERLDYVANQDLSINRATWPQWGGAKRDFSTAAELPETGRPVLMWRKSIGKGQSAVVTDGEHAYVHYKKNNSELLGKLSLENGMPVWQAEFEDDYRSTSKQYQGPNSTPVITDDFIYCITKGGTVRCFSVANGETKWSYALKELGTTIPQAGYGSSPLVWKDLLIVSALGNASPEETEYFGDRKRIGDVPGAIGIDRQSGKIRWKSDSFRMSHSSPILVDIEGQELVVFHGMFELVALDPESGRIQWRYVLRRMAADNVAFTPIWDSDRNQILISHGYCDLGTQAIGISRNEDRWKLKRKWNSSRLQINHTNAVVIEDQLIASNRSPNTLLVKLNLKTGEVVSRLRGFEKANLVGLGQNFLLLESDGMMSVQNPGSITKKNRFRMLSSPAWTVPTMTGSKVLVRDTGDIKLFRWASE